MRVDTTPSKVREALRRDQVRPTIRKLIKGKYYELHTKECDHCGEIYTTPFINSRYHSLECKADKAKERYHKSKSMVIKCHFCDNVIDTIDKRRKFCNEECREKMRKA